MESSELMMLTDQDINYKSLSENTLKELASGDELFMATSALGELSRRKSHTASAIAGEILFKSLGDCYLQAAGLETLFKLGRKQALDYISAQVQDCSPYILNSIMEIIIENEPEFQSNSLLAIVTIIQERLKEFDKLAKFPEPEVRNSFLKSYVKNIQKADALTQS